METCDEGDDNVIQLFENITPDKVLMAAIERGLTSVVVVGNTPQGTMYVSSSGDVTRKDALWLLENAKMSTLGFEEEAEE